MPWARLLGIASGSLALAAVWGAYNAFMPLLLAAFVESRALRGAIMGLDNVFSLLLIPIVGAWSDRIDGRFGPRLPFLLVGVPLAAFTFAALPWAAVALFPLLLLDVAFLAAVTLYRAPLVALMPDHVPPERRSAANAVITLMGAVGGVLMLVLLAPTFDRHPAIPFAAAGALSLVSLAIVVGSAQRRAPFKASGAASDEAPTARALLADVRALADAEHARVRTPLLGLFLAFFGFAAFEAQFTVAATEAFGVSGGQAGRLLGLASAAFVAAALPVGALARRVGEGRAMLLGAALLAVAVLGVAWAPLRIAALLAAGVGWACVLVPAYPIVVALGGRREVGRFTGAYYLAGSAAAILAPGLAGAAMDAFGAGALVVFSAIAFVAAAAAFARMPASG